jgi:hypothetical protein
LRGGVGGIGKARDRGRQFDDRLEVESVAHVLGRGTSQQCPVERAAVAPRHDLTFSRPRLLASLFRRRQKQSIELEIQGLDARSHRIGQFDRRQPAAFDQPGRIRDRQPMQIRVWALLLLDG